MKRILHAVAALWLEKTGDRRAKTEERSRETEEDRSPKTGDRLKTEDRRAKTGEDRSRKTEEWGLSHEGPWLFEARNGLLQHLTAMMRMGETVRELAIRECAKEQPSESANVQISSTNQQIDESTPKNTDNHLPKRVIISECEQPAERIGEPLPIAQVLARVYLRHAPRCAMGDTGAKDGRAKQPSSASSDSANPNSQSLSLAPRRAMPLATWVLALFMCLLSAQQVSAQAEPAAAAVGHQVVPYQNEQVISKIKSNPLYDLDMYPMVRYEIDYELLRPLKIGDRIPDEVLDLPLWVVNRETRSDTITLRDTPQDKLLILDFWASWCKPCVESMTKWDSIRNRVGDGLVILGVHIDFDYKAYPFVKRQDWGSNSIIGINAHLLNRHFFDRKVVSRAVWIMDGRVIAVTGSKGYDADLVRAIMDRKPAYIKMAYEWTYSSQNL